jgi:glucose-1-phosphate thymidylyltransferase
MAVSFSLGEKGIPEKIGSMLLLEFGKAALIGVVFGFWIRSLLPRPEGENPSESPLREGGIETIHLTRQQAASTMLEAVKDPRTLKLWISGISLRDFFLAGGTLNAIWDAISDRLQEEDKHERPVAERLKVRILLLDPWCPEGDFRSNVEQLPQGLKHDVPLALRVVLALSKKLKIGNRQIIEVRLYQHGSFAFQFVTESFALVEQYTYRDQKAAAGVPLIKYHRLARPYEVSRAYDQIEHSYGIVWEHARTGNEEDLGVGVGSGLRESRLKGVFRQNDRDLLGERQRSVIDKAGPGDIIDIQAISARYYARSLRGAIQSTKSRQGGSPKIRLLILNPTSRSAILRAVADETALEDIGVALRSWTWEKHRTSQLYSDVHDTMRTVERLRLAGCDIDLRLSAADLSCAMFQGRSSLFVEQYAYGRSRNYRTGVTLGGEYDAFEYERVSGTDATSGESILESAFEVLWDSYSMSREEYCADTDTEERRFERELNAVLPQLGGTPPQSEITMVILAAGYGVRIAPDLERTPDLKGKPKALLPVCNTPMIDWLLKGVSDIPQIGRIIVVTNDLYADQFSAWYRAHPPLWERIKIVSDGTKCNDERRGAIGALRFAISREEIRGNVFVVGADNFFVGGFKGVIEAFLRWHSGVVVVHDEGSVERVAGRLGVALMDRDDCVTDFEEKPNQPKSTLASTLCYVLTPEHVRHLKGYVRDNPQADNSGDFIRHLVVAHQGIKGFRYSGEWRDIGTFAEYQGLCRLMEAAESRNLQQMPASA